MHETAGELGIPTDPAAFDDGQLPGRPAIRTRRSGLAPVRPPLRPDVSYPRYGDVLVDTGADPAGEAVYVTERVWNRDYTPPVVVLHGERPRCFAADRGVVCRTTPERLQQRLSEGRTAPLRMKRCATCG